MACNICGDKIENCEACDTELRDGFYCFEEVHFCEAQCWEAWILEEERGGLKKAIDDLKG